jgi:hypothetical protein
MSKFWSWLKSFFVTAQPVIVAVAEARNPSLAPEIQAVSAAISVANGAADQKA